MKGYIGRVRPDGKIDVTLQKTGIQQTADFAEPSTSISWTTMASVTLATRAKPTTSTSVST